MVQEYLSFFPFFLGGGNEIFIKTPFPSLPIHPSIPALHIHFRHLSAYRYDLPPVTVNNSNTKSDHTW